MKRALPEESRLETITFPHIIPFLLQKGLNNNEACDFIKKQIINHLEDYYKASFKPIKDLLSFFYNIDDYQDNKIFEQFKDSKRKKINVINQIHPITIDESKSSYYYDEIPIKGQRFSEAIRRPLEEDILEYYWKLTGDKNLRDKMNTMHNSKMKRPGLKRDWTIKKAIQFLEQLRDQAHTDKNIISYHNQLFKILNWDSSTQKEFYIFCIKRYEVVDSTIETFILAK